MTDAVFPQLGSPRVGVNQVFGDAQLSTEFDGRRNADQECVGPLIHQLAAHLAGAQLSAHFDALVEHTDARDAVLHGLPRGREACDAAAADHE